MALSACSCKLGDCEARRGVRWMTRLWDWATSRNDSGRERDYGWNGCHVEGGITYLLFLELL